jgi:hypothetical protein
MGVVQAMSRMGLARSGPLPRVRVVLALGMVCLAVQGASGDIVTFSTGESLPETISQAPAGFGNFGGTFFIPDPGAGAHTLNTIWNVPANGGPPTAFTTLSFNGVSGLFLLAGFGSVGGQYLVTGGSIAGAGPSVLVAIAANGTQTPILTTPDNGFVFVSPVIAPATFGTHGGDLFVARQSLPGEILDIKPDLSSAVFATTGINNFGMAFAPAGFGSVGGDLLVSDTGTGTILAIDPNGVVMPFANVPVLQPGVVGLRQIGFAPAGFGAFGGDLLVSVSGSQNGGGTLGQLLALDGNGNVVGQLDVGSSTNAFDPRGFFFPDSGHLLLSDASSGSILLITPNSFTATPEPTSFALLGCGVLCIIGYAWRRRSMALAVA